jgi:hypothetical protein
MQPTTLRKEDCLSYDYTREPSMIWVRTSDPRYPEVRLTVHEVQVIQKRGWIYW